MLKGREQFEVERRVRNEGTDGQQENNELGTDAGRAATGLWHLLWHTTLSSINTGPHSYHVIKEKLVINPFQRETVRKNKFQALLKANSKTKEKAGWAGVLCCCSITQCIWGSMSAVCVCVCVCALARSHRVVGNMKVIPGFAASGILRLKPKRRT